jgi:hypothetical protein
MDLDLLLGGGGGGAAPAADAPDPSLLLDGGGAGAIGGMDDLLLFGGGGGGGLDDLLFGGGGFAPPAPAGGGGGGEAPPVRTGKKVAVQPAQPSTEALKKYITTTDAPVYLVRFVSVVDAPGDAATRRRSAFIATNNNLLLMSTPTVTERSIPIQHIIGIILSVTEAPRRFGPSGQEVHVLMHVRGVKDLYIVLGKEEGNDETEGNVMQVSQSFVAVLTALCASFGDTLSVSTLKRDCESLESFFSPLVFTDDDLRSRFHQALAARTMQLSEMSILDRDERSLDFQIATLKNSDKGATVSGITQDISQLEEVIGSLQRRERDALEEHKKVAVHAAQLKEELSQEEARRLTVIKSQSESAARDSLMRHVAEYELAKKNHKRELQRVTALTAFLDRYARETTRPAYDGGSIAARIDDLTELGLFIQANASSRAELNSKVVKALTENRKRAAHVKELLKQHTDHVATIEGTASVEGLSVAVLDVDEPDNIEPVIVNLEMPAMSADAAPSSRSDAMAIAQPKPAAAPINLDDDDDDI